MSAEVAELVADLMRDRQFGDDTGLWDTVCELGLSGIGVPEEAGGSGGTLADLATAVLEFAARGIDLPLAQDATARWAEHVGADEESALLRLAVLRAAATAGAARGAYELTRTYLRSRNQFGKPLVAIPMVATSLASMRVEVLQAQTALAAALDAADSPAPGRAAAAAEAARVVTATTATVVATRAHQLHGAIGTTQEYALHHLTKLLWAARDLDLPESRWAERLGARAMAAGEDEVWDVLTAPAAQAVS